MGSKLIYGAIEAGGTKFQCALGTGPDDFFTQQRIATTTPLETLAATQEFFERAQARFGSARSFGLASFGPIDINQHSPNWGHMLATPKPGWSNVNMVTPLRERFGVPVHLDTDVNAAAFAEWQLDLKCSVRSLAYITVGTGIGVGLVLNGHPYCGLMHPEMGHMVVRRDPHDKDFQGICPFHEDCLEGLASGPAIIARWGRSLDELNAPDVPIKIIGFYLGQLVTNIALMLSCERVVMGGGVMQAPNLLAEVRVQAEQLLNGYLPVSKLRGSLIDYVCAPGLGERSGIAGAMLLAMRPI